MAKINLDGPGATAMLVIYGDPVGYCTTTFRGKWVSGRYKKYLRWKETVQGLAVARGLILPLRADEGSELEIETRAFFRNRTHSDPESVHRGVKDALFYGAKGKGDKYTGGTYAYPLYDATTPRVVVTLRRRR